MEASMRKERKSLYVLEVTLTMKRKVCDAL